MFSQRNIHKYTWTFPNGKIHNQIDHILIDRRWYSSIQDVRSFRVADSDTDHYLMVSKVRERLAVSKKLNRSLMGKDLISGSYMSWRLENSSRLRLQTGLQLWRT